MNASTIVLSDQGYHELFLQLLLKLKANKDIYTLKYGQKLDWLDNFDTARLCLRLLKHIAEYVLVPT